MAFFDFLKKSTKAPEERNYVDYRMGLNLNPKQVLVTPDSALTLTAVYAAVRIIAETIAQLPLNYYKKTDAGREIDADSSLQYLIHSEPNQTQTKYVFWDCFISTMILYGNAYAYIERDQRGLPLALTLIHPDDVKLIIKNGRVTYEIRGGAIYDASDFIHIPDMTLDGYNGISRITIAADNIALGIAAQTYGKNFFESGGKISGVLRHPGQLGTEAMQALSGQWHSTYHSGYNGSFKTAVLEEGMDYKPIQLAPDQAQFLATRKFSISEIARLMRVPPHLLGDLERATFSNIEAQGIEFVQFCIAPILVKVEQELNKKLIFENLKGQRYFEHSTHALMRGDSKSRGDYYAKLFSVGALSPNEIRRKENLNDAKDGDGHYVPMNMIKTDQKPKEVKPKEVNPKKEIIKEDETEEPKE